MEKDYSFGHISNYVFKKIIFCVKSMILSTLYKIFYMGYKRLFKNSMSQPSSALVRYILI